MRKPDIEIREGNRGGGIKVVGSGSEAALSWWVGAGSVYGIEDNSPALRSFLRKALRRLEAEAKPKKRRRKKLVFNKFNRSAHIML